MFTKAVQPINDFTLRIVEDNVVYPPIEFLRIVSLRKNDPEIKSKTLNTIVPDSADWDVSWFANYE